MRNRTKRTISVGLVATLLAMFGATIGAVPALGSTSVTSAGSVLPGGISAGTASFTLTENAINAFPNASGTLTVTITDSASASTVHFSGTPVLSAPGSLGATLGFVSGATSFTVTTAAADVNNIEPITVSGLRISADVGAAAGAIKAAMSGSLVGAIISPTTTATGDRAVVRGCRSDGGHRRQRQLPMRLCRHRGSEHECDLLGRRRFARDHGLARCWPLASRPSRSASVASTHVIGTTITQTVADCLGANLGSPGTVGTGSPTQHLVFTTQPGGGAAGVVWSLQPVVAVENTSNVIVTSDNSTVVTLSIATNPAGGTLSCTSGLSRTVVNGVATFSGCSINAGSASAYTLSATSSPAWTPATSNGFLVGSTQHLAFITQPGGGPAGVIWLQQPVVAVRNALGQVVTGDNSTVVSLSIGSNPAGGTLSCTSGLARTVVNGVATFFGCSISIGSTGLYTLNATSSPAWTPATSAAFTVGSAIQPVVITDWIAAGVNRGTAGFGTASVVVSRGGWITLLGTTSPNLGGSVVQVWTRTKTGAWHVLTSRVAAADGTVHYFARINAWTAYQFKFPGDSTHSAAASHGRIATSRP